MKSKIASRKDIELLVDHFYEKVRKDGILGEIFDHVIKENWPEHLAKMYRFWETVLLDKSSYHGSPFAPHAKLPVEDKHFDRWVRLFKETVDEHFEGEKAERAKWQGERMAEMFNLKIKYFRKNNISPIA